MRINAIIAEAAKGSIMDRMHIDICLKADHRELPGGAKGLFNWE